MSFDPLIKHSYFTAHISTPKQRKFIFHLIKTFASFGGLIVEENGNSEVDVSTTKVREDCKKSEEFESTTSIRLCVMSFKLLFDVIYRVEFVRSHQYNPNDDINSTGITKGNVNRVNRMWNEQRRLDRNR